MAEHFFSTGQGNRALPLPPNPVTPDSSKTKEVNRSYLFWPLYVASLGLNQI